MPWMKLKVLFVFLVFDWWWWARKKRTFTKKSVQSSNSTSCVHFLVALGNSPAMARITRTFYSHLVFLFTADDHESDVLFLKRVKWFPFPRLPSNQYIHRKQAENPHCNCSSLSGEFGQRNSANIWQDLFLCNKKARVNVWRDVKNVVFCRDEHETFETNFSP